MKTPSPKKPLDRRRTQATPGKPALLILDLMNHFDFVEGDALARQALKVADNIMRLRGRFDAARIPVIYVNDNWMDWQADFSDLVERCRQQGGVSARLAQRLAPKSSHYYILKPMQSAFYASALPVLLQQLEVDRLVITGVATDACVLNTALDAQMRKFPLWVPSDASAAPTLARHRHALQLLDDTTDADIRPAERIAACFPE